MVDDDVRCLVPRTARHHGARYHHHRVVRGVVTGCAVCLRRGPARVFRDEPRPRTQRPERPVCRPLPSDRGVCRHYAMTFDGGHWTMTREDPDFHQRFIADVEKDRIVGSWQASEDAGKTWRKDYDLTFERA